MTSSQNLKSSKWLSYLFFGIVALVAGGVRWVGLWRESLNWDELNILAITKLPLTELFRVLVIRDFHPPGFHLLLKLWTMIAGDTDTSIHLLAWTLGMAAFLISIGFAHRVFKDWRLTGLTAVLLMLNPFLVKYAELATHYSWHTALVLLSWFFLWRRQWWGYGFTITAAIHAHVLGVWFLPWQAFWLWRRQPERSVWLRWGICVGIATLSWLPFLLPLLQPGHVSHQVDVVAIHNRPWELTLLAYPLNVLLLGVDRIETTQWPEWGLITLGSLVWVGLLASLWRFWRTDALKGEMLLGLTIGPILIAALMAFVTGMPVLVPRALLFCVPGMVMVLAWGLLNTPAHRYVGMTIVGGILWIQCESIAQYPITLDLFYRNAMATRQFVQSGDGIIVAPGWSHLGFVRYYDPMRFGLTQREQHVDPTRENVFQMIQEADDQYLFVSGEAIWRQPETKAILNRFMQHRRILVIGWEDVFLELFDCKRSIWVLENNGRFSRYPCMRKPS